MTLDELITALEAADPALAVQNGFANPHSYRGYYEELAFEPAANVTVAEMLDDARNARGATFQGYKGGDFTMGGGTDCWLAEYGSCGETIGALLIQLMLTDAVLPAPADRAAVLTEAGWVECSPEWLAARPGECGTAPRLPGGPDVSHWHPLRRLADEAQQPEAVSEVARLSAALERGRRLALTFEVSGNEFIAAQIRTALGADDAQDPIPADRGTAAAIDETAATIQAEGAGR